MYSTVVSGGIYGIRSYIAKVEVDIARGLPGFDMVGRLSKEVTEARERVRVALKNSGIEIPPTRITINISPANQFKSGTGFDFPIAIGILAAMNYFPPDILENILLIGELGLNGDLCPVHGILPIISHARDNGIHTCLVPIANAPEAAYVEGIRIIGITSFTEAVQTLTNLNNAKSFPSPDLCKLITFQNNKDDFAEVAGQEACKRAALIAAAGNHHLMISGPPGSGKTMIARRMRTILPALTTDEILEISSLYSIAGKLNEKNPLITVRPFQSPHHATSLPAFLGDRRILSPGILSLSHKGILFLDEFPEFSKECIESLREPLESKTLQLSRANGNYTYPADFLMVAAANPCPCGYFPDRNRCNCTDTEIRRYQNKISGPIRDRIDLTVTSHKIDINHLSAHKNGPSSEDMRKEVLRVRELQSVRYADYPYNFNSDIPTKDIELFCSLTSKEFEYASQIYNSMNLSARSYHKLLRVARTIADLDGSERIRINHLSEAVCYRG